MVVKRAMQSAEAEHLEVSSPVILPTGEPRFGDLASEMVDIGQSNVPVI
jgi:hypothetical protein